jgi:hypothetical protein
VLSQSTNRVFSSRARHEEDRRAHLEVPQLPRASPNQHHDLSDAIPHRSRIRQLAQIPKIRFPLPLILLLPPDILKLHVQLPDLGGDFRDVRAVVVEVRTGFADCDVKVHSNVRGRREPGRADVRGGKADRVVSGIVRGECEPTGGRTPRVHQRSVMARFLYGAAVERERFGMLLVTKEKNEGWVYIQSLRQARPSLDFPCTFGPPRAIQAHDIVLVHSKSTTKRVPQTIERAGCGIPSTIVSVGSSSMKHRLSLRSM